MSGDTGTGLVFVLDGTDYEAPSLYTFDMSERRVMFDLAGIVEEDFVQQEDETEEDHQARVARMTRHPGFMEALMHVAFQRGNPDMKRAKVQALIDKTNFHEAIEKWADADVEDDADPPPVSELTSKLDEPSHTSSFSPNDPSGADSVRSSGLQGSNPASIGTSESDTSATSARSLSAA